jgi:hypothetical protein
MVVEAARGTAWNNYGRPNCLRNHCIVESELVRYYDDQAYQLGDGSIRSDSHTELTPDSCPTRGCGSDLLVEQTCWHADLCARPGEVECNTG